MPRQTKSIYIGAFTLLGFLLASILHAVIEIPVINLLVADFDRWSLGLTWEQWFLVHHVGAAILWIAGVLFGYKEGQYWWQVMYVEKKTPTWVYS